MESVCFTIRRAEGVIVSIDSKDWNSDAIQPITGRPVLQILLQRGVAKHGHYHLPRQTFQRGSLHGTGVGTELTLCMCACARVCARYLNSLVIVKAQFTLLNSIFENASIPSIRNQK